MPRDVRAYLSDAIDACDAISSAVDGLTVEGYSTTRLVRSAVEREFIIIGEALQAISQISMPVFGSISQSRRIVDFRNQLTHQYPTILDDVVWEIIAHDVPVLRRECDEHLRRLDKPEDSDEVAGGQ